MVIGSLAQLWAVGALLSLAVVIYLGLMILKGDGSEKRSSSLTGDRLSQSEASTFKPSPPPPGEEVVPPGSLGGSN